MNDLTVRILEAEVAAAVADVVAFKKHAETDYLRGIEHHMHERLARNAQKRVEFWLAQATSARDLMNGVKADKGIAEETT